MVKKLLSLLTTFTLLCLTLSACNIGNTTSSSSSGLQFITQPTNTTPAGTTNGFISNVQVEISKLR